MCSGSYSGVSRKAPRKTTMPRTTSTSTIIEPIRPPVDRL